MSSIQEIIALIQGNPLQLEREKRSQDQLSELFGAAEIPYRREVQVGTGIIDFMFEDGVGLEMKLKGQRAAIVRQCLRYLESPLIHHLILATSKSINPVRLTGKPVTIVHLGRAHL